MFSFILSAVSFALRYCHLFNKEFRHHQPCGITDTTDRYGPIIMVGGDFSHTRVDRPLDKMPQEKMSLTKCHRKK